MSISRRHFTQGVAVAAVAGATPLVWASMLPWPSGHCRQMSWKTLSAGDFQPARGLRPLRCARTSLALR